MLNKHKNSQELAQELEAAKNKITIGAKYLHHKSKDKIYIVLSLGFLEANDELCVIYRAEYGERLTFVRSLTVWLENVEWKGKSIPRFSKA